MSLVKVLFCLFFLVNGTFSSCQTDSNTISPELILARKICLLDFEINDVSKQRMTLKANGIKNSQYDDLVVLDNALFAEYDSLRLLFLKVTQRSFIASYHEFRKLHWFIVIQDILRQKGITLSANERYNYAKGLPDNGGSTFHFKTSPHNPDKMPLYLSSAVEKVLNQYHPNWIWLTYDRIQKLSIGIDMFLKISRAYFIPFTFQSENMNCGPTCLKIVFDQWGKFYSLDYLGEISNLDETGTSFGDLSKAANKLNVATRIYKETYEGLLAEMGNPVITHWKNRHFVVVYAMNNDSVWAADPEWGRLSFSRQEFCDNWLYGTEKKTGKGSVLSFDH